MNAASARYHAFPTLRSFAHQAVLRALSHALPLHAAQFSGRQCPVLVDATCGNGHDTLFLLQQGGKIFKEHNCTGRLLALDIQAAAVENTQALLRPHLAESNLALTVEHASHANLAQHLADSTSGQSTVAAAMFNLGYLPGSDKSVVTMGESTQKALQALVACVMEGGIISVHAYGGHGGGQQELDCVREWFAALPEQQWTVFSYGRLNKQRNPEQLFLAERSKAR